MPPLTFFCGLGRVCRLIMLECSTVTVPFVGFTASTRPVFPRSRPVITLTVSPLRIPMYSAFFFSGLIAYHTSGASETILVNFFSRSSRATGPKTRVPTGSFASLISTAALSSKRI
jgi:hypothetical protein